MTFHPVPIRSIQDAYFATIEQQVVGTALLVGSLFLANWLGVELRMIVRERRGPNLAEAAYAAVIAAWTMAIAIGLTIVWNLTYAIRILVEVIVVDRWTAILSMLTVAIGFTTYLLIRLANRSIDRLAAAGSLTEHQSEAAYHVADVGISALATLLVLSLWGVQLTNLILGAGVLSAVLGLAAQQTVAAIIAGFVLLFARPFRVGDWIGVVNRSGNERTGIVKDITIFNTKIQTFNDEHVLVPNNDVMNNQLINYSHNDRLRIEIEVGVDYDTDLEAVRELVETTLEDVDAIADAPSPQVVIKEFGDSAIVLGVRFWIDRPSRMRAWQARTAAMEAIDEAFEREGVTIPFPQRVHDARGDEGLRIDAPSEFARRIEEDD